MEACLTWSSLPGLRMAESMMSGLLVAPMMNTFFLEPMPSISVRILGTKKNTVHVLHDKVYKGQVMSLTVSLSVLK